LRLKESGVDPVSGEIGVDLLQRREAAKANVAEVKRKMWEDDGDGEGGGEYLQEAVSNERAYNRAVENEVLKDVLVYGGGSLTTAALIGSTLESVRRALKGKAPIEEEEEPGAAPAELPAAPRMAQNGTTGARR
jgi:hypothetical protein